MPKQHVYRISDYAIHNAHKKQRAAYLPAKLSDWSYLPGNQPFKITKCSLDKVVGRRYQVL